jgi:hypothetical protein
MGLPMSSTLARWARAAAARCACYGCSGAQERGSAPVSFFRESEEAPGWGRVSCMGSAGSGGFLLIEAEGDGKDSF